MGEAKVIGSNLIQDALNKVKLIKERLLAAQSRLKAYADNRQQDLKFAIRDMVFVKVSPLKGIM